MRTFAWLFILVVVAASQRSRSVFLRGQSHRWFGCFLAAFARLLGA